MSDFKIVKLLDPIVLNLDGPSFTGEYSNVTSYTTGESVSYLGSSYVAIINTLGNLPTDTTYWQLLAAKGDQGDGIVSSTVRNQTGVTIAKFNAVYISGASGNRPLVSLAKADDPITSSYTFGVTDLAINNNAEGIATQAGLVSGLDTSMYTAGDLLWLSEITSGAITNIKPDQPDHSVLIGYVTRSHPTLGTVIVSIQNGAELKELHDVLLLTLADGQTLKYEASTGLWKNHTLTKSDVGLSNVQNLDQTDPNNIVQDSTHRFTTDVEKAFWNADFIGENDTIAGTAGNVPAPALYDGIRKKKFLRADGAWSAQTDKNLSRSEALTAIGQFTGRVTTANQWFDVCYSPELNLFVAIAASGTNRISISKDGKNWRDIAAPANNVWTKIIWSPALGIFCAVSYDGASRCMTSPDGVTWTLQAIALELWYDITWSNKLNLFCATSLGGGTGISTSPNGVTWTQQTVSGASTNFYTVTWSHELEIFCAIRLNGNAYTSPDGVTWTARTIGDKSWSSVCWSPELGIFCAVGITGTNRCATSPDGITWIDRAIPACLWRSVTWAAELGMFIALCSNGSLSYSFDGTIWVSGTAPEASNQWYSGIWAKEAGLFVICGITGTNRIMTSRYTRGFDKGFNPESKNIVLTRTGTAQTLNKIDAYNTSRFTSATAVTITVPSDTTSPTVMIGDKFKIIQDGTGVITFAPDTGITINAVGGVLTSTQYECIELEKIDLNTWSLSKSNTPIPGIPIVDITQDGKLSSVQYAQLSFDMARDISINSYYKKLTYSLGDLTTVEIFTDNTETVLQYTKALTYTLGDLTSVVITRDVDSATATKTLTYTLGNLTSIEYN